MPDIISLTPKIVPAINIFLNHQIVCKYYKALLEMEYQTNIFHSNNEVYFQIVRQVAPVLAANTCLNEGLLGNFILYVITVHIFMFLLK